MRKRSAFFEMETMSLDLPSIGADLKRHWWNILLVGLAGMMLAYMALSVLPLQEYSTTTVFVVYSKVSDVVSSASSANTIASALTSVLSADVLKNLVQADIGAIAYEAQATYTSNTNLITLVVTTSDPQSAFLATKSILTNYPTLINSVMDDVQLRTLQQASIPEQPDTLYNVYLFVVLGFFAGCAAYAAAVSLLSILRDTVKNESDVRHKVDTLHIATIPYIAAKHGEQVALFSHSIEASQMMRRYELAAMRAMTHMERHDQKVLLVTSAMPNEGKTTSSVQLAIALANSQKNVLLIDGDFRNPSIAQLLQAGDIKQSHLAQVVNAESYTPENWYRIPGTQVKCLVGTKGQNLSKLYINNDNLKQLIEFARATFDYIVVDTGPTAFVSDTERLADLCDAVVLVVGQDATLARAINDTIDLFPKENQLIGCIFKEVRKKKQPY